MKKLGWTVFNRKVIDYQGRMFSCSNKVRQNLFCDRESCNLFGLVVKPTYILHVMCGIWIQIMIFLQARDKISWGRLCYSVPIKRRGVTWMMLLLLVLSRMKETKKMYNSDSALTLWWTCLTQSVSQKGSKSLYTSARELQGAEWIKTVCLS